MDVILEGVHVLPEPRMPHRDQAPLLDQPRERLHDQLLPLVEVVEDLLAEHEVPPVDPDVGRSTLDDALDPALGIGAGDVERGRWRHGDEARHRIGLLHALDQGGQVEVGQVVAVVGEEELVVPDVLADPAEALADRGVVAGVDEVDAPAVEITLEQLDASLRGEAEVVRDPLLIAGEVPLDDVGLVAEAEDELLVAEGRVVLHHVPEDRPVADLDHGLGDGVGHVAQAHAQSTAEEDDLHAGGWTSVHRGMGTKKRAPHSRA